MIFCKTLTVMIRNNHSISIYWRLKAMSGFLLTNYILSKSYNVIKFYKLRFYLLKFEV